MVREKNSALDTELTRQLAVAGALMAGEKHLLERLGGAECGIDAMGMAVKLEPTIRIERTTC